MSHFSEIKTKIKNTGALKKALKAMGYVIEENEAGVDVRGYFGATQKGEFKILTDTHYDIGFVKDENGDYQILGDWELMPKVNGIEQNDFTTKVKREYARQSILEMAEAKGLDVETQENNGVIEMVVTQW